MDDGPLHRGDHPKETLPYTSTLKIVTLSPVDPLTIPRQRRESRDLLLGGRLQMSVDRHGRLVLVPALHAPEDLFLCRPPVARPMGLDDMDRAIAAATGRGEPQHQAGCEGFN